MTNHDLTSRWAFNPKNPRGPKPDDKQAESYADRVQREYDSFSLYGRQDRPQPQPKKRPQPMSFNYRKTWTWIGIRFTISWRPIFHLPRLGISVGGNR